MLEIDESSAGFPETLADNGPGWSVTTDGAKSASVNTLSL